jgi:hypothetical protein
MQLAVRKLIGSQPVSAKKLHLLPFRSLQSTTDGSTNTVNTDSLRWRRSRLNSKTRSDPMTDKTATVQVFRIVIKASANAIWDAITKPEWTERYA